MLLCTLGLDPQTGLRTGRGHLSGGQPSGHEPVTPGSYSPRHAAPRHPTPPHSSSQGTAGRRRRVPTTHTHTGGRAEGTEVVPQEDTGELCNCVMRPLSRNEPSGHRVILTPGCGLRQTALLGAQEGHARCRPGLKARSGPHTAGWGHQVRPGPQVRQAPLPAGGCAGRDPGSPAPREGEGRARVSRWKVCAAFGLPPGGPNSNAAPATAAQRVLRGPHLAVATVTSHRNFTLVSISWQ